MKKTVFLIAVMALLLVAAMCFAEGKPEAEKGEGEITIGLAMSSLANPYFLLQAESAQARAIELGVPEESVIMLDAQDDANKQANQMLDLIAKKVDIILLNPCDSDAVGTSVMEANRAGIPIVTFSRPSHSGEVVQHLDNDNIGGARDMGHIIAKALNGKGQVISLEGTPGAPSSRDRVEGFGDAMSKYPDIKIVASQPANYQRQMALEVMENLLEAHPNVDAVFAHNDEMALGVLAAMNAAGRDDIPIYGFDGAQEVMDAIDRGEIAGTMILQPVLQVRTAVDTAYDYVVKGIVPTEKVVVSPCIPYP